MTMIRLLVCTLFFLCVCGFAVGEGDVSQEGKYIVITINNREMMIVIIIAIAVIILNSVFSHGFKSCIRARIIM